MSHFQIHGGPHGNNFHVFRFEFLGVYVNPSLMDEENIVKREREIFSIEY